MMHKFDTSCGLTKKQIGAVRFAVKNEILRHLPILPDPVEIKLFLEGREAWIYNWNLNERYHSDSKDKISLEVVIKLKREFHHCEVGKHHRFSCIVQPGSNIYRSKVAIIKKVTDSKFQ